MERSQLSIRWLRRVLALVIAADLLVAAVALVRHPDDPLTGRAGRGPTRATPGPSVGPVPSTIGAAPPSQTPDSAANAPAGAGGPTDDTPSQGGGPTAAPSLDVGPFQDALLDPPGSAASRITFWSGCGDVVSMSDQQLDQWSARGVGGFVCMVGHLRGMGGDQDFVADPSADLSGSNFDRQRSIRDTGIVGRAAARGIKLYLGFYLSNYSNTQTPLGEWFDDGTWQQNVLPHVAAIAGAARELGFAGLAFDEELYPGAGGAHSATWNWNYPGNANDEQSVRAAARTRGTQMMQAITSAFPDVQIIDYGTYLPESWAELVQQRINGVDNAYLPSVQLDFWDGLTSVDGYGAIRFMDATFYKTAHLPHATWDAALQYDLNRKFALLSRRLSNWSYASSRILFSPFAWISNGSTKFEAAYPPDYVAAQLAAFRRWGMAEFANYTYNNLDSFDYGPYTDALRAAATPGQVADAAPSVTITGMNPDGDALVVTGTAADPFAVRYVRWTTATGSGMATMQWQVNGGDEQHGYDAQMIWSARLPLESSGSPFAVTVEDTKGMSTVATATMP